jgi:hypothetical protein
VISIVVHWTCVSVSSPISLIRSASEIIPPPSALMAARSISTSVRTEVITSSAASLLHQISGLIPVTAHHDRGPQQPCPKLFRPASDLMSLLLVNRIVGLDHHHTSAQ